MKHVLDVVYHNAALVAWTPAMSHLPARPVQVNKGWGTGCGPSSGEYGVGHGCGQLYSMCFIIPHLVTCHVPPAHPVQVNNGMWSNT